MKLIAVILLWMLDVVPAGQAWLKQLQPRDSVLIADQLAYGFELEDVAEGTPLALPDLGPISGDTLVLVRGWQLDSLARVRGRHSGGKNRPPARYRIRGSVVLAPFEEGTYRLPDLPVLRGTDTLLFEGLEVEVKTMPVDTATFVPHDIKDQMRYPLTFREILPWLGGLFLLCGLVALCVVLARRRRTQDGIAEHRDPAYIVALRELEKWRGERFWAPDKQKAYYSGITDILKTYIGERFGIDAREMTTDELFTALGPVDELPAELRTQLRELFDTADFVKFAKHTASDEDNARALPLAVRFVTSTYQTMLEEEQKSGDEL